MIDGNFEFISNLQYRVRDLTAQLKAFKSGEKYVSMRLEHRERLAEKERENQKVKQELAEANCQIVTVRENWLQVIDDINVEHAREVKIKDRLVAKLRKLLFNTEDKLAATQNELRDMRTELYQVKSELEDANGIIQKLKAQINRDYENSSLPSSQKPNHKKISNNRVKTDRKPGGQPGHKGHGRKKQEPTNTIRLPTPEEYANNPDYKPTGRTITKQLVNIYLPLIVDEYSALEYMNVRTRQRVHAEFPEGVINDVNYGGSIKAFAFLLNNYCNVSIAKVSDFLRELTDGKLNISTGMISGLSKEFSAKTQVEQKVLFNDLLLSPVMNTDFTTVRYNGKNAQVIVCATPGKAMYIAREHKGHSGVRGTPVEDYQGILVHDHDKTFYSYGSNHQECLQHPSRYLKDSISNEPGLKWNEQMLGLIQEMIHFRNSLDPEDDKDPNQLNPDKVNEFEKRYLDILATAKAEYEYEPASKYYRDGYNLYKRLGDYKDNHLLFLYDKRVPANNNLSERLLRVLKRKLKQVMTFRSFDSISYLCDCMGIIELLRTRGQSLFASVSSIFD
jgi:hypothetical protein